MFTALRPGLEGLGKQLKNVDELADRIQGSSSPKQSEGLKRPPTNTTDLQNWERKSFHLKGAIKWF